MKTKSALYLLLLVSLSCSKRDVLPPKPVLPVPSQQQLAWQEKEVYAFVHFTVNTFTGKEWGYGDEDPNLFNPTDYNPEQWAEVLKKAGFKGAILTAKHHDGFCLWPSKYTNHSVKNIQWKDGKGDVVGDFREACNKYGLEFGVYLSPWDRNHAEYGRAEYVDYYHNQLKELLENYGPMFEVWFDGANGGDGYYGGARETRKIDDQVYYNWPVTYAIVKKFNPQTLIFGDARTSTEARWCGNEKGYVGETNWNMITPDSLKIYGKEFNKRRALLNKGDENGDFWMPAEVDVSIRPGWFYHEEEDSLVKTPDDLFDIYLSSVGRGSNLLLNVAPDRRGLVPEPDVLSLFQWSRKLNEIFANNLAPAAKVTVDSYRGKSSRFSMVNLTDGDKETYWATDDNVISGSIELDFEEPKLIEFVLLQEYIKLGQRVKTFNIEVLQNGQWEQVASATTIGYKRIVRINPVETEKVRINITGAKACLAISNIGIY